MDAGVTTTTTTTATTASSSSILDKPLSQLTEEDISQLTREDCRKFLKEKGMRRPSWNKSQAIQQVILLKALLESNDDSGAGALRKILVSPPPPSVPPQNEAARVSHSADSVKEAVFGEEESSYGQKDLPLKTASMVPMNCRGGDRDNKTLSPRSPWETNELAGQMTIFYCGKINVYDGVTLDKVMKLPLSVDSWRINDNHVGLPMHPNMGLQAQAIMHLAANPSDFPQDNLCSTVNAALSSFVCHLQAAGDKNVLNMPTEKMIEYQQQFREKGTISRDCDVDGQVNRKVSLQRYLEKRKDRGRFFKGRKNAGQTSSSLEMYLNHQIRTHNSNGQSTWSRTSSPPQSGFAPALCSSADDHQVKVVNLSVDLTDESCQEH